MKLGGKLLIALAPLTAGLVLSGVVAAISIARLGDGSRRILSENYRSVLAAQRMKEAAERIDSAALYQLAGRAVPAAEVAQHEARFADELAAAAANVTEPGEAAVIDELKARWATYRQLLAGFEATPQAERAARYFAETEPAFTELRVTANRLLDLNQDAMRGKSSAAMDDVRWLERLIVLVGVASTLLGLLASITLTRRALRPLGVLAQAVRRVGEGDLAARAKGIAGKDEVADLAREFNTMAERLERYRKSSLGELLEAQQAAQGAIDSLSDPVVVMGGGGRVLNANRAAEALGVELESATPLAKVAPEVRAALEHARDHVLSGRGPYSPRGLDEAFASGGGDSPRHYLPRATPLYGEEGAIGAATIVLQDVTRLLRFDELKNNLVSTVAHEFRTPLTSLRMAIHLCTEELVGPLTEKQADLLHAAREDCARLATIVDELLDLSRIQAGNLQLRRAPVAADDLCRQALDAQRASAETKQVTLRSEVEPGTGTVQVDEARIQLVLSNLLSNAIRYSPEGAEVVVRAAALSDGRVRFEVSDAGPGIPPEYREAIFDRGFQLPGQPGGAGLGLFIAREIVQAHGGQLELATPLAGPDGKPTPGTTFRLYLPVAA